MRWVVIAAAGVCMLAAHGALAAPLSNSEIGLNALGKGQYSTAIAAFTKALKSDDLTDGLKVFAYDKRGAAHARLHQNKLAIADFQKALAIDPSDAEATAGLAQLQIDTVAVASPKVVVGARSAWGPLKLLVGHTWLESGGTTGRWYAYSWEKQGEVLTVHGMDQEGNAITGRYQLDRATGHVSGLTVYKGRTVQSELADVTDTSLAEDGTQQGVQVRESLVFQHAGLFQLTVQALVNGSWKQVEKSSLVEVSPEVVAALGWKQAPQESGFMKFLKGLGGAVADGAKAGVTDGVHDGVAAKTRHEIAPKQYPNAPQ